MKSESQPKNIKTLVEEMIKRKHRKDAALGLNKNRNLKEALDNTEETLLLNEAKTSYFTLPQYRLLDKKATEAQHRLKEQ